MLKKHNPDTPNLSNEPSDPATYQSLIVTARTADSPEERINAIHMLAELGPDGREALESLDELAASDENSKVKSEAAKAAKAIRGAS